MTEPLRYDHLRSTYPRREPLRAIVLHWTAGIGPPAQVYATLRGRTGPHTPDGLSIHYTVGVDGEVVQMASTKLVCLHAGIANKWSIGIEVVSPGFPGDVREKERSHGVARDEYTDSLRGRSVTMLDYTAAQTVAVERLVEKLCDETGVARAVPLDTDGSLLRRTMDESELAHFHGVMGHYHCHETKADCGTRPLERLRLKWSRPNC